MRIRIFKRGDGPRVREIAFLSWKCTYREIFSEDEIIENIDRNYVIDNLEMILDFQSKGLTRMFVSVDGSDIIGFAQISFDNYWEETFDRSVFILHRIYLDPDYFGRGIGFKLLVEVERFVKDNGGDSYFLYVHRDNQIGIRFYTKNGFRHIVCKDNIYDDCEYYFEKKLYDSR